ncbi:MAG TPA: hypothetical protein VIJ22_11795, partial [Polyangiaceae bacterium]
DTSIVAVALPGGRSQRVNLSRGDAVSSPFLPVAGGVDYATRGGSYGPGEAGDAVPGLARIDEATMARTRVASGTPLLSARIRDAFYFLELQGGQDPTPGEVDLYRVPFAGGDAKLLADDLATVPGLLGAGDELVVKTRAYGIRAYSGGGRRVARVLVDGAAGGWEGVEGLALARGSVVYVAGKPRTAEIRAVSLQGGPSWQVAPPHRDPRNVVADDAGIFWVNLVDPDRDPYGYGLFVCEPHAP